MEGAFPRLSASAQTICSFQCCFLFFFLCVNTLLCKDPKTKAAPVVTTQYEKSPLKHKTTSTTDNNNNNAKPGLFEAPLPSSADLFVVQRGATTLEEVRRAPSPLQVAVRLDDVPHVGLAPLTQRRVLDRIVSDDGLDARVHILVHDGVVCRLALFCQHALVPSHDLRMRRVGDEDAAVFQGKEAERGRQGARGRGQPTVVREDVSLLRGDGGGRIGRQRHHAETAILLWGVDGHTETAEPVADEAAVVHTAVASARVGVLCALFLMRLDAQQCLGEAKHSVELDCGRINKNKLETDKKNSETKRYSSFFLFSGYCT